MLLRSGKDLSPILDFHACSENQVLFIENKGLWSPPLYQQVKKESYPSLAKMNSLGFITVDSVDWVGNRPFIKYGVHSTVSGFIRPDTLLRIKKNSTTLGASVCLIHHIITEESVIERIIMPVNYIEDDARNVEINQCHIRLYYDLKTINYLKKRICLNPTELVEYVTFVDMQGNWNPNDKKGLFTKIIRALENV